MSAHSAASEIRDRAARLCRLITFLSVALWVLLAFERFGEVSLALAKHGFVDETVRRFARQLIAACPEVFYLVALWWTRQALAAFARGELYAPTITRMLDRVGAMLAAGAVISVFLVPGAERALGVGPEYWIAWDVSGLVLGAIGLSLTIIARVLRRASDLQAELDEIF